MSDRTCFVCSASIAHLLLHARFCSKKCKWTAENQKRNKRTVRACPGCGNDISAERANTIYCSTACRKWVDSGHINLRVGAIACLQCGDSLAGKMVTATYCSRACKSQASESRRTRDDASRYTKEREQRIVSASAYAKANPHVGQATKRKRKALLAGAESRLFTPQDWLRVQRRHDGCCVYCGKSGPLTMDHVIPLIRGGRHAIGNILPACARCNSSKNGRYITEWKLGISRKIA
jgi:5-methylcytosine-specific restriction endonuclease McrA